RRAQAPRSFWACPATQRGHGGLRGDEGPASSPGHVRASKPPHHIALCPHSTSARKQSCGRNRHYFGNDIGGATNIAPPIISPQNPQESACVFFCRLISSSYRIASST